MSRITALIGWPENAMCVHICVDRHWYPRYHVTEPHWYPHRPAPVIEPALYPAFRVLPTVTTRRRPTTTDYPFFSAQGSVRLVHTSATVWSWCLECVSSYWMRYVKFWITFIFILVQIDIVDGLLWNLWLCFCITIVTYIEIVDLSLPLPLLFISVVLLSVILIYRLLETNKNRIILSSKCCLHCGGSLCWAD